MVSGREAANATARSTRYRPTIGVVINNPPTPNAANASASPIFAVQAPTAPAATHIFAIAAHLCDFACGRNALPCPRKYEAIFNKLASNPSRSTIKQGVGKSCFDSLPFTSPLANICETSAQEREVMPHYRALYKLAVFKYSGIPFFVACKIRNTFFRSAKVNR